MLCPGQMPLFRYQDAWANLIATEPEGAMSLALSRRAQPEKFIKTWAYEDGREAKMRAMEVPDPAFSGTLMQQASRRLSGRDPSAAAAQ